MGFCGEKKSRWGQSSTLTSQPLVHSKHANRTGRWLAAKCLLCAQDMYRHLWRDAYLQRRDRRAQDLDKRETRGRVEEGSQAVPALRKCLQAFI